ncbi:TonB-dependent receptor [bacterium]|nr:TonB-dependent receptor [bacterium]
MKQISRAGLCLLCLNLMVMARQGTIEGTVTDAATGYPLSGCNIMIKGSKLGAAADRNGEFVIDHIAAGRYTLEASMIGYGIVLKPEITVEMHRVTQVHFELSAQAIHTESVSVTDSYFNQSSDALMSGYDFSSREIRSSPGSAEDVFRMLKSIPGVGTTGSKSANLIVRGGDRNENLTLLDGIEISSPLHFSREDMSMGVISIVDPAMIRNVEFLTGGFPAEYGDRLSSVFELKIKDGNRTQFNHDINLSMAGFNAFMDGPLSGNTNMVLTVRRGVFDLFTKMMGRSVQPRYWDMLGKVTWQPATGHQLSLIGFYYLDDAERREKMEDHGDLARKFDRMTWNDYGSAVGLNWRYLFNDRGFAMTTLEWTGNGNESKIGYAVNPDLNGDDNLTQNMQLKSQISYRAADWIMLKTGAYIKRISSDYDRWREADTLQTGFVIPAYRRIYQLPVTLQKGAFVQASVRPSARLTLNPGLRFDTHDLTGESYLSPRLGMGFHLTGRTTLNASWGIYHQAPSALAFSRDGRNLALKSSKAEHRIMGIEHRLSPDMRVVMELYTKDLERCFSTNDTTNVITNDGSGFSRGVEITLQKKMSRNLMASVAYTWSESKRKEGPDDPEFYFDYDRRHNLIAMGVWQMSEKWRLGIKAQAASGNPCTPVNGSTQLFGEWFVVEGEKNAARFPDYQTLDVRVDRSFRFSGWTLNMYLEVWNLLNRENVLDYYYECDAAGTPVRKTVADFPIMPMLGFNAQF